MKNPFLVLSLVLALSVSCVRELTLDPGEEPMVVVDCVLFDESPQTLRLFYSRPPAYSEMTPITEAEVELIDKTDGKTAGMFVHQEGREWTLDYSAVPEHEYRLEVRVPGHDLVYAEDTMPEVPGIWARTQSGEGFEKYGERFVGTVFDITTLPPYTWIYALNYNSEAGRHEIAEEICRKANEYSDEYTNAHPDAYGSALKVSYPFAGVYKALQEYVSKEEALQMMRDYAPVIGEKARKTYWRFTSIPGMPSLLWNNFVKIMSSAASEKKGYKSRMLGVNGNHAGLDILSCPVVNGLVEIGMPEVAPVMCAIDQVYGNG